MKYWITLISKSILAALLICIGCIIYINCENNIIGSFLFSIGLLSVILLKANLFTGKIGYIHDKKSIFEIIIILTINLLTAFILGIIYKYINGFTNTFDSRLLKDWYVILFDGFICGILIYLAVELYNKSNKILPIIICVIAFILSGSEHSIADMFYFASGELSWIGFGYIWLIILGNSLGSLCIRGLQILYEKNIKK